MRLSRFLFALFVVTLASASVHANGLPAEASGNRRTQEKMRTFERAIVQMESTRFVRSWMGPSIVRVETARIRGRSVVSTRHPGTANLYARYNDDYRLVAAATFTLDRQGKVQLGPWKRLE
jgi:hypothetical protein